MNYHTEKLVTVSALLDWRELSSYMLTTGVFDLLHPGHVWFLNEAKAKHPNADLVVLLDTDESVRRNKGPTRPKIPQDQRAYMLASLACVDYVVYFESPQTIDIITTLRPDFYVKGRGYDESNMGLDGAVKAALEACDTQIDFIPFDTGYSTTKLIRI